ncbi:carboxylesterase/lipase family protein [Solimonas terrae]|uniref:Carboxylic ester hydrolase n=1 Tax=Solimonas terrae TaxID=1396819 RepID=A0A6M2BM99_9GAMM|nr:carboxylesterase family protein [Solimonas terrae]NGY03275.1 carboxylesterase family protein [Solimonas terrae]
MLAACLLPSEAWASAPLAGAAGDEVVNKVEQGTIRGQRLDGVDRYLGLPFAKPPVGALRWQPPQAPDHWDGTRDARHFGPACAQIGNFYTSNQADTFDRPYGREDCLYLNVWAPQKRGPAKPVIVFIHGGGSISGAASLPLYDGRRLATELDVVFVSINYRLGFFGIVDLPALKTGDPRTDSGSFALLDQIRALEWVQQNIASFGGDASKVVVMGHSAGCTSIWNLMSSPLASGKFGKVVCLSGMPRQSSDEERSASSKKLLAHLLLSDGRIASEDQADAYLRTTSPAALRTYLYAKPASDIVIAARGVRPVRERVDGHVLTAGKDGPLVNPVPAILGTTRDEAQLLLISHFGPRDFGAMWKLMQSPKALTESDFFASRIDRIEFKLTSWVVNRVLHRYLDRATRLLAATSVPVYRYEFEWDHSPEPWRSLLGAYHGIDVSFLFGNFSTDAPDFASFAWRGRDPGELERVHREMVAALRGFIDADDPDRYEPDLRWQRWSGPDNDKIFR